MDQSGYIACIVAGMEKYIRLLALADNQCLHEGDVEWISPLPDNSGISLGYKMSLEETSAARRIDELVTGIRAGTVPSLWFISPTSTPENAADLLVSKGFRDLSDPDHPELGMALNMEAHPDWPRCPSHLTVSQVGSLVEFAQWIDVVNEALHGWPMLKAEYCGPLYACKEAAFYLVTLNGVPVATAATVRDGDQATLEFVSTLEAYRKLGAATAVCTYALQELRNQRVRVVTLRAEDGAVPLYTKLGFVPYFATTLLSYPQYQGGHQDGGNH